MIVDVARIFSDEEIFVKTKDGTIVRLVELTDSEKNGVIAFRLGRYGKYLNLPLAFEADVEWLYVAELLRTDGHVSPNCDRIKFTNKDETLVKAFISFCKRLKIDYVRLTKDDSCYRAQVFNKTLSKIFARVFSITPGNKSLSVRLPEWYSSLTPEESAFVFRGAFDGDGCVQLTKGNRLHGATRRLRLYSGSENYLKDVQKLFLKLSIDSRVFKDPRENNTRFLQIGGKRNILRFHELVGFNQKQRKEKLTEVAASFKNYAPEELDEKICSLLRSNAGERFTVTALAERLHWTPTTLSEKLIEMENSGRIVSKRVGVRKFVSNPSILENGALA